MPTPDTPAPWPTVSTEPALDCRILQVERVRARAPRDGREHTFFRLRSTDWINVIPLTDNEEVVMVRQWRHGTRAVTLEIPGGMVDPGEDPETAGRRETREETGYEAGAWTHLGTVEPNPALFDNHCHTYLARGAHCVGGVQNEGAEETHVVLVPLTEIPARIRSGEIAHALVIAAFHWLHLHGEVA